MASRNVLSHVETAGNFKIASNQMCDWIRDKDIAEEQIISISSHETSVEEGDSEVVLFYFADREPDMKSARDITYHFWKSIEPWSVEESEACEFASKHGKVL
jgi:hypothetical protein